MKNRRQGKLPPPSNPPAAAGPPAVEALFRQARAHHGAGELPQAEALYREILAAAPGHPDALHLLGVLAGQVAQPALAVQLIDIAIQGRPDFPEAHFSRANALYALQRFADAVAGYDRALQLNPLYAEAHSNRGSAQLALQQPQAALHSFDRAIQIKPNYADAHSNRANALCLLGQFQAAVAAYDEVLCLRPDSPEAHHNRGNALYFLHQYQAAAHSFARAVQLRPDYAEAWVSHGNALHALRSHAAALESYDRAIHINPALAEAHSNRGSVLFAARQYSAALESYDRAIQLNPASADALSNRSAAQHALHQYQAALESADRALQLNPASAEVHYNRGNALHGLERHSEALESFAIALRIHPGFADAWNNRGNALLALEQYPAALESYDQAIQFNPAFADAHSNRGNALQSLKQYQSAIDSYDQAIRLEPRHADAHYNRGNVLQPLKRFHEALESYNQAFLADPNHEYLRGIRSYMRRFLCDWDGIDADYRDLETRILRGEPVSVPFPILSISQSPALQKRAAELYARHKFPARPAPPIPPRPAHSRIRIGYYSADFHNHATSYLMAELFERHDRSRFEIFAFSFGLSPNDHMNRRVSAAMDRFFDVRSMSDREVAELSRELEIDIAVDLKGFTQEARTGIFAWRAAPIQVSYLGYPGTMGAEYIDYLIADPVLIPPALRPHYTEKILSLPDSYQVNDTQRPISPAPVTRAAQGLPQSAFVFCCFNNLYKITPAVFDLWMRILAQVDGSVLWLLEDNPRATANLRTEAERRGIAPHRLVFAPNLPLAEHLARHRLADLVLDTLPYNAHTTASDALWVGLPVLTRTGDTFAGRVAASLLHAIHLPELVTATEPEFEQLAVALARDPERLHAIRRRLEHNRLTTPLFDIRAFTGHLEAAYTAIYQRGQSGLPPEHIDIPRSTS